MLYVIGKILRLVFFLQPPILFYLKRKLKWRINSLLLIFLSLLLGWFLLFLLGLSVGSYTPGEDYPVQVILFILLMSGWFFSGVLLLLWSPFIVLFSVKNKKIKLAMALIILAFVSFICVVHFSAQYDWGVPGNQLIHEGSTHAGFFDGSSLWVFEAKNALLKQKMIRKWDLKPMRDSQGHSHPISFAVINKDKPEWWPSRHILDNLEGYGFIHESDELYRSLWYDPNGQRLYLERGNW